MGTSHGRVNGKKTLTGVIGNFQYFLFILAVNCASHSARPIISGYLVTGAGVAVLPRPVVSLH